MMSRHIFNISCSFMHQIPCLSSVRLYSRWVHRKPAKVLLPFEPNSKVVLKKEKIIDLVNDDLSKDQNIHSDKEKNAKNTTVVSTEKFKDVKENRQTLIKKRKFYLSQKKVFDDKGDIIYEKLNNNDSRISSLLVRLKSKKERIRSQQILVEGWRLIVDGLEAKCRLKYVIFSQTESLNKLKPFLPNTGVNFYKIPYKEIELWSDVETSPGIFGVFDIPTPDNVKWLSKPMPIHLICDNVRTPGNLGGILRSAVGVGCEKVLLTKGCTDHWDPKVIRGGAGAHFRQPIISSLEWEELPNHLSEKTSIFIADSKARGIDELEDGLNCNIPIVPYYSVDFGNLNHITLIIGGETEGISEESYRFAEKRNGLRLNIPLQKGVDSLNTGMATAVIAFEMKKQFIQAWTKANLARQELKSA